MVTGRIHISIILLFVSGYCLAQCTYNEEIVIQDLSVENFTLIVSGALNNDLSDPDQGLCGVLLEFNHEAIGDLTISLTSPAGQTVTLVGPAGIFENTFFTKHEQGTR